MYYQPELNLTPEEVLDYLRKSQSDDPLLTVEEVLSKHESILDEWAENHLGGKVPEDNKYREVASGETIKDRPEINKVLRRIESPKVKAVKVVEPQRLTRGDLEDIGRLMKLFKHTNTLVITPQRVYDLRDEYDWDAFERELKRGNDYLEYTKKILNRGRLLSVSQGNYLATLPPFGFEKTTVMDGKRKCPTLKIREDEAEVVRMIFDMYVNEDLGRPTIARRLNEMGFKTAKGGKWTQLAIADILENVHYTGKVRWNFRKTVTIVEEGEIIATRPKAKVGEYLIYDGKHSAIVSDELFNAAQAKQSKNPRNRKTTKVSNPFAGMLYCHCGKAMVYRIYKKPDGSERNPPRLLCTDQADCNTGSCLYSEMVVKVSEVLKACIEDFEVRLQNDTGDSVKLHAKLINRLEQRMKDIEARELAQWESQSNPDPAQRMPAEIFKKLNENLLKEKEEVRQSLCKAYESMPEPVNYEEKIRTFSDALIALNNPAKSAEEKNMLLKKCISRMIYNRERPQRLKSQQIRFYDPTIKRSRYTSPLKTGGNWSKTNIELDVKLVTD